MMSTELVSVFSSTFVLVALAEFGDKSQLVCMTLAARHRQWPVLLGATVAFVLLNALAVWIGLELDVWLPGRLTAGMVAVLFGAFGVHALFGHEDVQIEEASEQSGHGIFLTALLLILVAEFGDKTQFAVAGMASSLAPLPVWLGATTALVMVSALGVWAGRTVLQRLPLLWLHRIGGGVFVLFSSLAAWQALG